MIVEGSFGLHAKMRLAGATFYLVCIKEFGRIAAVLLSSARLQSKMGSGREYNPKGSRGRLHKARIILTLGSLYLSDRMILAVGLF